MALDKLDCEQFHRGIVVGCHWIINNKIEINSINVFPVADGDTGDNMASLANAIIHFSSPQLTLRDTSKAIADASIIGARGNSGMILAQFFNSLAENMPLETIIEFDVFAHILQTVSREVEESIPNPVEGTILTLIKQLAFISQQIKNECSFELGMTKILPPLLLELQKTTHMLPEIKKSNVVDAGALGFYFFLEGFTQFLQNPQIENLKFDTNLTSLKPEHLFDNHSKENHRYCTEAVLKSPSLDKNNILNFLMKHGEHALVTSNNDLCRFHVHTENPQIIFAHLCQQHTILYPKVDDMRRQFEMNHAPKGNIALVSDSSADLSQQLIDKHQIHLIPINIQMGQHQLLDKYCFEENDFYANLNSFLHEYPKTSYPSLSVLEEKFGQLSKTYENVLVISVSKAMSGMYEAFIQAAKNYSNITVIDSKTNSGAHGLLLNYAGELIEAGQSIKQIIKQISNAIRTTYIYVAVNQFDSMVRSGRMSNFKGRIATWSKLKPIVSVDCQGKGFIAGKSFSRSKALTKSINYLEQSIKKNDLKLEEYCIVHANAESEALEFAKITSQRFNKSPLYVKPVSLAIGLHAGQGCVALAARLNSLS
ncbi:DegV family protein [Legionella brunensis]|uniref:DegV family protein n=1 Tax=Legionella brunensis TaxID=29422 RepID=UPI001041A595|nr:DegV family protein [Legionella brunensis]